MNTAKVRNAYQKSEAQSKIHPVKLIHLLFERVLLHLELAEQGIVANDVKARGENLSKAIAIISELNASIKDDDGSEAAGFLHGLYSAILLELAKVSITQDVGIVRLSYRYLRRLLEIWESTAMVEAGLVADGASSSHSEAENPQPEQGATSIASTSEYGITGGPKKFKTMEVAACCLHGVSVSI